MSPEIISTFSWRWPISCHFQHISVNSGKFEVTIGIFNVLDVQ